MLHLPRLWCMKYQLQGQANRMVDQPDLDNETATDHPTVVMNS